MTNQENNYSFSRGSFGIQRIIVTLFGIIEFVLAFRFVLKLLGASENNGFVNGVYNITQPVVALFEGIFSKIDINSAGVNGVLEPAVIIAALIIGLIGWVLLKLISKRYGSGLSKVA